MNKLLIIGGFPPPITGQKLNNQTVFREMDSRGYKLSRINIRTQFNKTVISRLVFSLISFFDYFLAIKRISQAEVAYLTISQSKYGFLRFVPFILLCLLFGKPYFLHLKGNLLPRTIDNASPSFRSLIYFILSRSNGVIFLSEKLLNQEVYERLKVKKYVLYNFVENPNYVSEQTAIQKQKDTGCLRLLYLSNLIESKGILDLLEAADQLHQQGISFRLDLAGFIDRKIESQINEYLSQIGDDLVCYHGVVEGEAKYELFRNSQVFVLPTYYPQEGQPISLLEAMASGNVIITTDHSGISDIVVDGRNGFYVRKQCSNDIQKVVREIVAGKMDTALVAKNNVNDAARYSVENFINGLEKILFGQGDREVTDNS